MRIYYSAGSDPMITDTVAGLNAISSEMATFLSSPHLQCCLPAIMSGSPAPYASFLEGLKLEKRTGLLFVALDGSSLNVRGSRENLEVWCSYFSFPESATEGDHHHPENIHRVGYLEPGAMSVIIEVEE